jgi:hypothetical protein
MTAGELFEILKEVSRDAVVIVDHNGPGCIVSVKSAYQSEAWNVQVFVINTTARNPNEHS